MCGIIGYIGNQVAMPILMEGLKRLEYRGYDSAGIALIERQGLIHEKTAGKVQALENLLADKVFVGTVGIAHTRWATHGEPTDINAHPQMDSTGNIAVVHNGIIENYRALRRVLETKGYRIVSETDTEILAHLISMYYEGNLTEAVRMAMSQVEGTYAIAVIDGRRPDRIVAARNGAPLLIGSGDGENFVASDVAAILRHTNRVVYMEDKEIATLTVQGYTISTIEKVEINRKAEEIGWTLEMIEKAGHEHFMHKEIFEQPETLRNAMRGRLNYEDGTVRLNGLTDHLEDLSKIKRIIITACGTSYHAALIGEYMIEEYAGIPVEVEYASEFRYRNPIIDEGTVVLVISQSGETADTLAAMREAQRKGAIALGIVNVVGSTIARESDGGVYIHAGPEIGVASTKAFTSQIMVLALVTILLGRMRKISVNMGREMIEALRSVPEKIQTILDAEEQIRDIAEKHYRHSNFLYLGRGANFPVALEGALKLKEISYIHAEGYPAAEMKHGPIALIDEHMPVVVIATRDSIYDKIMSNIEQVKARGAHVIAIATEGDTEIAHHVNHVLYIPQIKQIFTPLLSVIPLQLMAYHIAVMRGCDVDQPRNLAKSVTVE
ncbi:MAG: glutamine--fructose-6-phosphate transaminase (isomerizing) [candidate division Zixibacteria bacterium]|nr:glutamine--fructose-6-phosphate transaminase (isomerizing) [candidate division Zixibacteria bacterium]